MADCPADCPEGVPYLDWLSFSPLYQEYLTYCALATAAANSPGPGPFQPIGVYVVTTDANYIAPADASLIRWDVSGQTTTRTIDFSNIQPGAEVQVQIINSNGQSVEDSGGVLFSLNDVAPRVATVRMGEGGAAILADGTAAQYDVGTSGSTLGLLNANKTDSGNNTYSGDSTVSGHHSFQGSSPIPITPSAIIPTQFGISMVRAAGGADAKVWDNTSFFANELRWRAVNDAQNAASEYMVITRSGFGIVSTALMKARLGSATAGTIIDSLKTGIATMAGGTIVVPDSGVTAGSVILVTANFAPAGQIYADAANIVPGVSFQIDSTNAADAGQISWQRIVV